MDKKFIFTLIIAIIALCIPVTAEEINTVYFNDSIDMSTGIFTDGNSYTGYTSTALPCFTANEITTLQHVDSVYVTISDTIAIAIDTSHHPYYPEGDELTQSYTFTLDTIGGGVNVGSGDALLTFKTDSNGKAIGAHLLLNFDDYDIGSLTGKQILGIHMSGFDHTKIGLSPSPYCGYQAPGSLTTGFYWTTTTGSRNIYFDTVVQTNVKSSFSQSLTYTYNEDTKILGCDYTRNGINNNIIITGLNEDVYYTRTDHEDITLSIYNNTPVTFSIDNTLSDDDWLVSIPTANVSTPSLPDADATATIHSYVYDAVTRNLIGNGHNVTVTYDDSSGSETYWPGGVSHTTIDWSGNSYVNFSVSSSGYSDSAVTKFVSSSLDTSGTWLPVGAEVTNSIYLNPIGTPSNTTAYATFEVREQLSGETYFYSSGAAVTVGNTTLVTSGPGSCSFELTAGTYQYTVKKTGFQTVSGSFSLGASNQYIYVELPKIPTAPTPTGAAGVDYPYTDVDPRAQAEESVGIIFDSLPSWAALCVIVVTVSFIGWMSPKKGKR